MPTLNELLTVSGLNLPVTSFDNRSKNHSLIYLADGTQVSIVRPAKAKRVRKPKVEPLEYHEVAYFGYPDSDGRGSASSRRVIIHDSGKERQSVLRGNETSDGYKFKAFKVSRMYALRIVSEVKTDEDREKMVF